MRSTASTRRSRLVSASVTAASGTRQVEVLGSEVVHRGADRRQIDHPQAERRHGRREPTVAPASEARPARGAQHPGSNARPRGRRRRPTGRPARDRAVRRGRRGAQRPERGGHADDCGEPAIGTRHRPPRSVEAAITIRHLPRRVRLVDEGCTPAGHDLVECARRRCPSQGSGSGPPTGPCSRSQRTSSTASISNTPEVERLAFGERSDRDGGSHDRDPRRSRCHELVLHGMPRAAGGCGPRTSLERRGRRLRERSDR